MIIAEQVDRTFYYSHYDGIDLNILKEERTNKIAQIYGKHYLNELLQNYNQIIQKGYNMFGN